MIEDKLLQAVEDLNHLDSRLDCIYGLGISHLPPEGMRDLMEMESEYMSLLDQVTKMRGERAIDYR